MGNDYVVTLHRYFIWANKMRTDFDEVLKRKKEIDKNRFRIESFMYMSLWYSLLYVLLEGWQKLKLKDKGINNLLYSNNLKLLKDYRNAVFHFHKTYYDSKFEKIL